MNSPAHRWEWRVFGARFPAAEKVLDSLTPNTEPQVTEETYLLGNHHVNVKIRFDLLDVKSLLEVDENRLELWAPELKTEFPISAVDVAAVHDIWDLEPPTLERTSYTMEQFVDELIAPDPHLEVAPVRKKRLRYTLDGCMAEMAEVAVGGQRTGTIAIEAEDPSAVWALVEKLGLSDHMNTSYSQGLRRLIGLAPVHYSVIDIGTNSVKFHVGEQHPDMNWTRVVDRAAVTRLGEGLADTGKIQSESLERTVQAISDMAEEARSHRSLAIAAVGTAALRNASNAVSAIETIRERSGVTVRVLSGEAESRLAFLAVKAATGLAGGSLVVFDTGGGSTQVTIGQGDEVVERFSVDVGAVGNTERFGLNRAVEQATLEDARRSLANDLARLDGSKPPEILVGMGGAVTNLTAVSLSMEIYDPDAIQGAVLEVAEIERQIEMYASMDADARRSIIGLQPNRAPVILAGALIVRTVMEKLGRESLIVSDRGLRHGLIRELFGFFVEEDHRNGEDR
jgi:exopolyphosphatase/guanosine-5'-triphosphate,3'-diphosphate pyrophosphatase